MCTPNIPLSLVRRYVSADYQLHVRQINADAVGAVHSLLKQYHP